MPSDDLTRRALAALEDRRESYHSAVATAVDEVRGLLAANRAPTNGKKGERAAAELGAFAAGRIDVERFESLFEERRTLDADAVERIEEALVTLTEILDEGEALHTVRVRPGDDLRDAVWNAMAHAGRAFGAGRAVENARSGTPATDYADGFAPTRWNRAERTVAPPLVVEVEGADLRPAALIDVLEGAQAIVLIVKKPAPPAALARLVSPGVLVVQDTDPAALETLGSWNGPAVVALVPEGAARFRSMPREDGPVQLTVASTPEDVGRPVGSISTARQRSDLGLLQLLNGAAAGEVVKAAAQPAAEAPDPTDKLAAWLLRQADVPGPGEA